MQWLLPLSYVCYVCQQQCYQPLRLSKASVVNCHVCQQQCCQLRSLSAAVSICCVCQLLRLSTAVLSTATSVSSVVYYVCQQRVVNCHVSAVWSTATSVSSVVCYVCQQRVLSTATSANSSAMNCHVCCQLPRLFKAVVSARLSTTLMQSPSVTNDVACNADEMAIRRQ
jgi:hypothetical protein